MKPKSEIRNQKSEIAAAFGQVKVGDLWKWKAQCPHCPFHSIHFASAHALRVLDLHFKLRHS